MKTNPYFVEVTVNRTQWEELQALLHVPHEHPEGSNECEICDQPLVEAAVEEIKRLRTELAITRCSPAGLQEALELHACKTCGAPGAVMHYPGGYLCPGEHKWKTPTS